MHTLQKLPSTRPSRAAKKRKAGGEDAERGMEAPADCVMYLCIEKAEETRKPGREEDSE